MIFILTPNPRHRAVAGEAKKSSSYKGVAWYKRYEKWTVHGSANGKFTYLGYFASEVEAARVYDAWARDFADKELNFRE